MWWVNAYIIEKSPYRSFSPMRRTLAHLRALAYTHQRIMRGRAGRGAYIMRAGVRMLGVRVKRAYGYMRGWRAHNRGRATTRIPRPYIRVGLDLTLLE